MITAHTIELLVLGMALANPKIRERVCKLPADGFGFSYQSETRLMFKALESPKAMREFMAELGILSSDGTATTALIEEMEAYAAKRVQIKKATKEYAKLLEEVGIIQ